MIVAAITLLAFGLRFYGLDRDALWIDEVFQYRVASQSTASIIANYRSDADYFQRDQAPLSVLLTHVFLLGNESAVGVERRLRAPSVIAGTATIPVAFLVASRFVSAPIALFSAFLLAISPLHIWYSQEARWYALWTLIATASYLPLLSALSSGRVRAWAAYAACCALGMYTFIFTVLVSAAQGVTALLFGDSARRIRRTALRFALVQILVLAISAPVAWFVLNLASRGTGTPRSASVLELPYTVLVYAVGFSLGPSVEELHFVRDPARILRDYPEVLLIGICVAIPLVTGLLLAWRKDQLRSVVLPWFAVPVAAVFAIGWLTGVTYQIRYTLAALPAFFILVTVGSLGLPYRPARAAACCAFVLLSAISLWNLYTNPRYAKEDARSAAAFIAAQSRDSSAAPVLAVGQVELAVEHYAQIHGLTMAGSCLGAGTIEAITRAGKADRLWVVVGRDWSGAADRCRAMLEAHGWKPDERTRVPGIEIIAYLRNTVDGRRANRPT